MQTLKFKSNINCGGCIAKVSPHLTGVKGIEKWEVDTSSPDRTLTVQTESLTAEEIEEIVKKAGFTAEEK